MKSSRRRSFVYLFICLFVLLYPHSPPYKMHHFVLVPESISCVGRVPQCNAMQYISNARADYP